MALTRVDGVQRAAVSHEAAMGTVEFDPTIVTPAEFIAELDRITGYKAEVTENPGLSFTENGDIEAAEAEHDHDDDEDEHEHLPVETPEAEKNQ